MPTEDRILRYSVANKNRISAQGVKKAEIVPLLKCWDRESTLKQTKPNDIMIKVSSKGPQIFVKERASTLYAENERHDSMISKVPIQEK